MGNRDTGMLARVVLLYLGFSALWILLSDRVVESFAHNVDEAAQLQTYKGLFFVAASAFVILLLLAGELRQRRRAEAAAAASERRFRETLLQHASELEKRVEERTAELASAKERAESADRLKSMFLATMSHELRTPLNSIIGFTDILRGGMAGPLTDEQAKQLAMVGGSADHLLALINDVLDLSRIEAGQLQVDLAPFDLGTSIVQTVEVVRAQAERKGLALKVAMDDGPGVVTSDQRRVEQVLLNLVANAVKFTDTGEVRVEAERAGERVAIRVIDTGPGIRPEDVARLFRPFSQLDSGPRRRHDGTGLGLAICRRLADRLGGEVRVASEPGSGSVFTFELPVEPPEATCES